MSERGSFAVPFVYDSRPEVMEPLTTFLSRYLRNGSTLLEDGRQLMGLMHAGYLGEEVHQIQGGLPTLLAALPEQHGLFTIAVLCDDIFQSRLFVIHDQNVRTFALAEVPTDL